MWQRRSHTCHYQRVRQPCPSEQSPRFTLDVAQQIMPTPDSTPCTHTCKHSRPFQPWRLLHFHTTPLAGTWTSDQPIAHYHQEDHWRLYFCSWRRLYPRPVYPTIPTASIPRNSSQGAMWRYRPDSRRRGLYLSNENMAPWTRDLIQVTMSRTVHCDGYGPTTGHLNTIPNCHSGTYSIWGLTISLKIKNYSSWDSWKESVTVRRLQHLLTEATSQKSNLYPSQGEKECAACLLMIKLHIKDTCSDCWLAHTCLCAVTITNVSRHLCEEVTSFEVGWISWFVDSC